MFPDMAGLNSTGAVGGNAEGILRSAGRGRGRGMKPKSEGRGECVEGFRNICGEIQCRGCGFKSTSTREFSLHSKGRRGQDVEEQGGEQWRTVMHQLARAPHPGPLAGESLHHQGSSTSNRAHLAAATMQQGLHHQLPASTKQVASQQPSFRPRQLPHQEQQQCAGSLLLPQVQPFAREKDRKIQLLEQEISVHRELDVLAREKERVVGREEKIKLLERELSLQRRLDGIEREKAALERGRSMEMAMWGLQDELSRKAAQHQEWVAPSLQQELEAWRLLDARQEMEAASVLEQGRLERAVNCEQIQQQMQVKELAQARRDEYLREVEEARREETMKIKQEKYQAIKTSYGSKNENKSRAEESDISKSNTIVNINYGKSTTQVYNSDDEYSGFEPWTDSAIEAVGPKIALSQAKEQEMIKRRKDKREEDEIGKQDSDLVLEQERIMEQIRRDNREEQKTRELVAKLALEDPATRRVQPTNPHAFPSRDVRSSSTVGGARERITALKVAAEARGSCVAESGRVREEVDRQWQEQEMRERQLRERQQRDEERCRKVQIKASTHGVKTNTVEVRSGWNGQVEFTTMAEKKQAVEKSKKKTVEREVKAGRARRTSEAMADLEEERRLAGEVLRQRALAQVSS